MSHGGSRLGAGRKPVNPARKKVTMPVSLDRLTSAKLRLLAAMDEKRSISDFLHMYVTRLIEERFEQEFEGVGKIQYMLKYYLSKDEHNLQEHEQIEALAERLLTDNYEPTYAELMNQELDHFERHMGFRQTLPNA